MIVLGIAAHPDDLDFSASGTFAKWVKAGNDCYYLICTDGRKGSNDPKMTEKKLLEIRKKEQQNAAKVIGLKGVYFLNHKDTELVVNKQLKKELVMYIRKIKPDIVVTQDPTFYYSEKRGYVNHSDHRAAGLAALDSVYPLARDRLTYKDLEKEGLYPHKVKTVYLTSFNKPTFLVDITKTIDIKLKALAQHKSQVDRETIKWMRVVAKNLGKSKNFKYAEGFVKLELPQ